MNCIEIDEHRAIVPEGVTTLERAAFRGRRHLTEIVLPSTLERIGDLAFSCTSVRKVRLSRRCVHLDELALRTGPETMPGVDRMYRSTIECVEADPDNPLYCVSGSVLCERIGNGRLKAVFCPGSTDEAVLGASVDQVSRTAFDGTFRIGTLRFHEAIRFEAGAGIAAHAACDRVIVDLSQPICGHDVLNLAMPENVLQKEVFATTLNREGFSVEAFCRAYDRSVLKERDRLLQARLMIARFAVPIFLDGEHRRAFEALLSPNLKAVCVHLAARGHWDDFDAMVDANMLGKEDLAAYAGMLSARGDVPGAAYLLKLKRGRFGEEVWDFGL